jgi:hypothetical protein
MPEEKKEKNGVFANEEADVNEVAAKYTEAKILSPEERYRLVGRLIEEIKLRKYSYETGRYYIFMLSRNFLGPGRM